MIPIKRISLICAAATIAGAAWAQTPASMVVAGGEGPAREFAISDITELRFADTGLSVVTATEGEVAFVGDWRITFGGSATGIDAIEAASEAGPVSVYGLDGSLILRAPSLQDAASQAPHGVNIVKFNSGKAVKIRF